MRRIQLRLVRLGELVLPGLELLRSLLGHPSLVPVGTGDLLLELLAASAFLLELVLGAAPAPSLRLDDPFEPPHRGPRVFERGLELLDTRSELGELLTKEVDRRIVEWFGILEQRILLTRDRIHGWVGVHWSRSPSRLCHLRPICARLPT